MHTADYYLNEYSEPKQFKPNELGIYDMAGNVSEWCLDEAHYYTADPQTDPTMGGGYLINSSENTRIIRGGDVNCFPYSHAVCTPIGRSFFAKTVRQPGMGFRLVLVD